MVFSYSGKRKLLSTASKSPRRSLHTIGLGANQAPGRASKPKLSAIGVSIVKDKKQDAIKLSAKLIKNAEEMPLVKQKTFKTSFPTNETSNGCGCPTKLKQNMTKNETIKIKSMNKKEVEEFASNEDNFLQDQIDFSNLFSSHTFQLKDQMYEQKLRELRDNLKLLEKIENMSSEEMENELDSQSSGVYVNQFVQEVRRLEKESAENMSLIETWFEYQKEESEEQFNSECKRASQEFQEKRKELKESLKIENEEMRRQIEVDRALLDINIDVTDTKPVPTRKLRRRVNATDEMTGPESIGANHLISTNPFSSTSILGSSGVSVASSVVGVVSNIGLNQFCTTTTGSSLTSWALQQTFYPGLVSTERKRKLGPATITFSLTDEEINEDLKLICI